MEQKYDRNGLLMIPDIRTERYHNPFPKEQMISLFNKISETQETPRFVLLSATPTAKAGDELATLAYLLGGKMEDG